MQVILPMKLCDQAAETPRSSRRTDPTVHRHEQTRHRQSIAH